MRDMGKKKPQKTKELSVAIAEASSTGDETQQPQTPRKRGRPRKIIDKTESDEKKEVDQHPQMEHTPESAKSEIDTESPSKKVKISISNEGNQEEDKKVEVEENLDKTIKVNEEGSSAASTRCAQKEDSQLSKEPPRRRARRKSKPRKSS